MFMKEVNGKYKQLYEIVDPFEYVWPADAEKYLTDFTKLILMRCIKPDKLVPVMVNYVVKKIGPQFIQPPPFDL